METAKGATMMDEVIVNEIVGPYCLGTSILRAIQLTRIEHGDNAVDASIMRIGGIEALHEIAERASHEYWDAT